jgi:hypothetical protein
MTQIGCPSGDRPAGESFQHGMDCLIAEIGQKDNCQGGDGKDDETLDGDISNDDVGISHTYYSIMNGQKDT